MASPWHRPDAASGVSDLDRLRRLVDTDTLPPRAELQAQFPDRAWRDIVRRVKYLRNPAHPLTPLSFRLSDRHPTPRMPASTKPVLDTQIRLPGPSALVLSDVHVPFFHKEMVERAVELAVQWGVPHVVCNGDTFDMQAWAKWAGDPNDTFEEELTQGGEIIDYLASRFERVVLSLGNHENRILGNILKHELKAERFLRMITAAPNVEISAGFEWTEMESPTGLWRFVHPISASVISGRVPALIASRRFTDSHVVGAHGHLAGKVRTEDGKRWAIDSGACLDPQRVAYATFKVGTRPVMNVGCVLIMRGLPYCLDLQTDWLEMAKMYN